MKKINALLASLVISASFAAPMAHAADSNLGASGYLNTQTGVSGYTGSLNQTTGSLSAGSTQASSAGSNLGSAGSESTLKSTGNATTTGQFTNNGIVSTSSFTSDTLAQTFGLAPTGDGFAQSSANGGTTGSALSTGNLQSGAAGLSTTGGFQAGLGLQATGFQGQGSGFGH